MKLHNSARRRALLVALGALISACGSLSEIANSGGNILRVLGGQAGQRESSNQSARQPESASARLCKEFKAESSADVDALYAKAMQIFGFRTIAERQFDAERMRGVIDDDFRHRAVPDALYDMTDYVTDATGVRKGAWMRMTLAQIGKGRSSIQAGYCLPRNAAPSDAEQYERMLRSLVNP